MGWYILVGIKPKLILSGDIELSNEEYGLIIDFIQNYSTLIINLIDEKIDSFDFGQELMKARGML